MDANSPILLLLKATLLLGIAFGAVRWERTSPAVRRHGVWSVLFVALLALPLLALSLPVIQIPVPGLQQDGVIAQQVDFATPRTRSDKASGDKPGLDRSRRAPRLSVTENDAGSLPAIDVSDPEVHEADRPRMRVAQLIFVLWLAGVSAALFALVRSLFRVRRLVATGHRLEHARWKRAAERIARQLALHSEPRLVVSSSVTTPMAGIIGQPTVFLPTDAVSWDDDRRDVVLTHEMTHLARKDPLRILAARIACALYWFHPLMWLAARRSTADCEQACDESVLALGIRPSVYARVLLDFAHQATPVPSVALPIVRRHRLENRVMTILSSSSAPRRTTSPYRTASAALGSTVLILSVAAARPAAVEAVNAAQVVGRTQEILAPLTIAPETGLATVPVVRTASRPTTNVGVQDGSCWNAYSRTRNFSGSLSTTSGDRIIQRIGRLGGERVAQMTFGDVRVCMVTFGYDGPDDAESPSEWIGHADRVILETERENDVRRLEIDGGRRTWSINGRTATMDDGVDAWRRAMLDLLDTSWEISALRGRESSLRGEISSVHGERSSLLGEISSLRGEVSSMQGEISSLRGEESSLRGEISSIRGHESSLRGQISSERGAISSLESQRWERGADRDAINARIRRHEDNIRDIEREIDRYDTEARVRAVEKEIAALDTDRKVAAVERRIREFDVDRKVAEVEREIAKLNVDREVQGIEREIRDLDVESRVRDMTAQREAALDRLRRALGIR